MTRQSRFVWRMLWGLIVLGLAIGAPPRPARGQEQDVIGIYFDQAGTITEHTTSATPEPVEAYVVLEHLSAGVAAIAASGGWIGTVGSPCWMSLIGYQFEPCSWIWNLGAQPPIPATDHVAVVKLFFGVLEPGEIQLFILPAIPPTWGNTAVYQTTEVHRILPLHPASGDWQTPCAYVNRGAIPIGGNTWSHIKALYR